MDSSKRKKRNRLGGGEVERDVIKYVMSCLPIFWPAVALVELKHSYEQETWRCICVECEMMKKEILV